MCFFSNCKRKVQLEDTPVLWDDISEREAWDEVLQEISVGWCRLAYKLRDFDGSRSDAISACAERLRQLVEDTGAWKSVLLFCADQAWQPDNRIIRYKGFWGRVGLPSGLRQSAVLFEDCETSDAEIRYFSALRLAASEIPDAAVLAHGMRNAIMFLGTDDSEVMTETEGRHLFRALYGKEGATGPFTRSMPSWPALLRWAVEHQTTVARPHGYFDEPFAGIDLVGQTSYLAHAHVFDRWDVR